MEATIEIDPNDGAAQNPNSIQVVNSAALTLTWNATNAASVNIEGLGDGQPVSGSSPVPNQNGQISLVAVAADGTQSAPFVITVANHDEDSVVSPHAMVNAGIASVISFTATNGSQSLNSANVGDTVTLTAVCSDVTDSCTINGQAASLTDAGDGQKQASISVTIASPMSGDFSCEVSANGNPGDPGSLHIDISTGPAAAVPSGSTTIPTAPIPTTTTAAGTITIFNGTVNPSYQPVDTDHFGVSMGLTFTGTLTWSGTSSPPGQAAALPAEWNTKLSDHINLHMGVPIVQAWMAGATYNFKSYNTFWDRFKPVDAGGDVKVSKNEKGGYDKEGKCSVNVGSVDIGEFDIGAAAAGGGISMPAATATLTVALGNVDAIKLWKSAVGVVQVTFAPQLGTIDISDNDVEGGTLKLSGTLSAQIVATGKGITVQELVKNLAEGVPEVAVAVAAVMCVVGAVYVAVETPSFDELLGLGPAAKKVCDQAIADYIAGVRGNSSGNAQGEAGKQERQKSIDKMKQDNPDITDDAIAAAIEQQIPTVTSQLQGIYWPKIQDQAWNNWATSRQGTRELATTYNAAVIAWQSIYPGVPYSTSASFTHYFELSDADKQGAAASKVSNDPAGQLKMWKAWVADNTGIIDASRSEAMAEWATIFGNNDYDKDPDYQKHWGR